MFQLKWRRLLAREDPEPSSASAQASAQASAGGQASLLAIEEPVTKLACSFKLPWKQRGEDLDHIYVPGVEKAEVARRLRGLSGLGAHAASFELLGDLNWPWITGKVFEVHPSQWQPVQPQVAVQRCLASGIELTREGLKPPQHPGGWTLDCCWSELRVRGGACRPRIAYQALGNDVFAALPIQLPEGSATDRRGPREHL